MKRSENISHSPTVLSVCIGISTKKNYQKEGCYTISILSSLEKKFVILKDWNWRIRNENTIHVNLGTHNQNENMFCEMITKYNIFHLAFIISSLHWKKKNNVPLEFPYICVLKFLKSQNRIEKMHPSSVCHPKLFLWNIWIKLCSKICWSTASIFSKVT